MIERMKKIMKRMYNKPVVETSELQAASQLLQASPGIDINSTPIEDPTQSGD